MRGTNTQVEHFYRLIMSYFRFPITEVCCFQIMSINYEYDIIITCVMKYDFTSISPHKIFQYMFLGKKEWNLAWSSQIHIIDIAKRRKCRKTNNMYYALRKENVGDTTNNLPANYVKTIITYRQNTIMPLIDFQCYHGGEGKCRRGFWMLFKFYNTVATTKFYFYYEMCAV